MGLERGEKAGRTFQGTHRTHTSKWSMLVHISIIFQSVDTSRE